MKKKKLLLSLCVFLSMLLPIHLESQVVDQEPSNPQKQLENQQKQIQDLQEEMRMLKEQLYRTQVPANADKSSQTSPEQELKKGPVYINKGKVFARIFMDYANNLTHAGDRRQGIDISRAYLGYDYQMTQELSARVMIDAAPEGILAQTGKSNTASLKNPVLKNAYIKYQDKENKYYIMGGMFTTLENTGYLKYWGNRYISKGLAVDSKMDKGTDIGIAGNYRFNKLISVEASIMNGEGYKTISKNGSFLYTLSVPLQITKNFEFKPLFSIKTGEDNHLKDKMFMSFLAGYKNKFISGGVEFAETFNDGKDDLNKYGYSIFINGKLNEKFKLIARYDQVKNTESSKSFSGYDIYGENGAFAGHYNLAMFGIEYKLIKNIKIAPAYMLRTLKNANQNQKDININTIYLFLECSF